MAKRRPRDLLLAAGFIVGSIGFAGGTALAQGTISGLTSTPITFSGHADDFVAGPDGNVWLVDQISNVIGRLAVDGSAYKTFPVPTPAAGLNSIIVGPDGNLWFTESAVSRVGRITTSGTITEFTVPAAFVYSLFGLSIGEGTIAVGPDGNMWISGSGQMAKVTTQGTVTVVTVPPPPGGILFDIGKCVAGPDGNLWCISNVRIAGQGDNHPMKLTTAGVATLYPGISSQDFDILKGPDGNLWISANGISPAHSLMRITPAGVETVYALPTQRESHLAVGADGNIWFTERTTMGNIWQMIVASATDDGHATFNSAPTTTYPEKLVAVTSPAGVAGIHPEQATAVSCPPGAAFYLSNAVSFGENLTWVETTKATECTDMQVIGFFERHSPFVTTVGCEIDKDSPNAATIATMTVEADIAATISLAENRGWPSCMKLAPSVLQCSASSMNPGSFLVADIHVLGPQQVIKVTCASQTPEINPLDNQNEFQATQTIKAFERLPVYVNARSKK